LTAYSASLSVFQYKEEASSPPGVWFNKLSTHEENIRLAPTTHATVNILNLFFFIPFLFKN